VAGVAAASVPLLAFASPASAEQASDDASGEVSFTTPNGAERHCTVGLHHEVDTETGRLEVWFDAGPTSCRGNIDIGVTYVNRHGELTQAQSDAERAVRHSITVDDAGSTSVRTSGFTVFDNCLSCMSPILGTETGPPPAGPQSPNPATGHAIDDDAREVSFTHANGTRVSCRLRASHDVSNYNGLLELIFSATRTNACQGTITIDVRYVNRHGDPVRKQLSAHQADQTYSRLQQAGTTTVVADYAVTWDNCIADCTQQLRTATK
jgi:hypothetical protein